MDEHTPTVAPYIALRAQVAAALIGPTYYTATHDDKTQRERMTKTLQHADILITLAHTVPVKIV